MKTLLGITTGLLIGFISGLVGMAALTVYDKEFLEFVNNQAKLISKEKEA